MVIEDISYRRDCLFLTSRRYLLTRLVSDAFDKNSMCISNFTTTSRGCYTKEKEMKKKNKEMDMKKTSVSCEMSHVTIFHKMEESKSRDVNYWLDLFWNTISQTYHNIYKYIYTYQ